MAAFVTDQRPQEIMPGSVSHGGICIYHHPHLPVGPDRLHGVLQGCHTQYESTVTHLAGGGGGEAVPLLQQGDPSSELCASDICSKGFAVRNRCLGRGCLWQARAGMGRDLEQEHMANLGKGPKIQGMSLTRAQEKER